MQTDLASDEGLDALAAAVERLPVPLRVIVNNAGITRDARLINMSPDDFRDGLGNQSRGRSPAHRPPASEPGAGRNCQHQFAGVPRQLRPVQLLDVKGGHGRADPGARPHPGPGR